MGAKKLIKGMAMGAVLAAVASLMISMKDEKNKKKARDLAKTAHEIKERVVRHGKKLGRLTKAAYGKIVDTTVAEYRGAKALSDVELVELKQELKAGWGDVKKIMKKSEK